VFSPDRAEEARRTAAELGAPLVAFMPVVTVVPNWWMADGAEEQVALRADAYASDDASLEEAIAFAASEERKERLRGPLRLTYLGSLGEVRPRTAPPVGGSVPLDDVPPVLGRGDPCAMCFRTGGHSDQNRVARQHARVERIPTGARVSDLKSTNGTWVNGLRISSVEVVPGDEIAVACTHRIRLDGAP
jgi:hypothetical protein